MPDGSAPKNLLNDPFRANDLGPEWVNSSALTVDDDPVSLQATARFAELAVLVAEKQSIEAAIEEAELMGRNSADPLDQVAADWAAKTDADEKIIHAFLGIDDPIGREAEAVFKEEQVDAALEVFLENLPDSQLGNGELAALSAFDKALEGGFDAEEALSAAIKAAENVNTSITVGAALAQAPLEIGLGWDKASPVQIEQERGDDKNEGETGPTSVPFVSIIAQGSLSNSALSVIGVNDAAFGFGFQFDVPDVEIKEKAENHIFNNRTAIVTDTINAAALTYTEVVGSVDMDVLVGGSGQDALGGNAGNDYLYTDLPTNYQANVHDPANPLTNPIFSAIGSADIAAGGAGDDFIWGGAGNDQLHGDVPDTSSSLFDEFEFGLGSIVAGDDTIEGGDGDDSIWGGHGNDVISGDAGDDTIYGDEGADTLSGNTGADNIFGYAGDDIIRGGEGDDSIRGGTGADDFQFGDGSGSSVTERVQSLGVDTIDDYSAAENDTFSLINADFGLGNSGSLADGSTYFEVADGTLSGSSVDLSGGASGAGIIVMGANSGTDGAQIYYTEDVSAASNLNSYQIADLIGVNASDLEAADFLLKS